MKNDQILAYYKKHQKNFKKHLKTVSEDPDEKYIHKIRKSTKRLQALFYFIDQYAPDSFQESKPIKSFRKLFRRIGEVRDHQVLHDMIKEYEGLLLINYKPFRKYIEKQEKYYKKELKKYLKKFDKSNITNVDKQIRVIQTDSDFSINEKLQEYIEHKEEVVRMLIHFLNNEEKLHQVRIALKDIHYLSEIRKDIDKEYKERYDQISDLQKYLQKWNDNVLMLNKIELFLQNSEEITKADAIDYNFLVSMVRIKKEELLLGAKVLLTKLFKVNFEENVQQ